MIISAGSEYFYNYLQNYENKIKESNINKEDLIIKKKFVIEIPHILESAISTADEDSVIPILLKFWYSNQKFKKIENELNIDNIFVLLSLTCILGIPKLKSKLFKLIYEKFITADNCMRVLLDSLKVNFT